VKDAVRASTSVEDSRQLIEAQQTLKQAKVIKKVKECGILY